MYDIVSAQTVVQGDSIFTLYSVQLRGEGMVSVRRRWGGGGDGGGEDVEMEVGRRWKRGGGNLFIYQARESSLVPSGFLTALLLQKLYICEAFGVMRDRGCCHSSLLAMRKGKV